MRGDELRRAKEDLATMKGAVGLGLPFGWDDVWWHLAIGLASLIGLAWALAPHGMRRHWGLAPAVVLALYYTLHMRLKYRRTTGRSPLRRREYTREIIAIPCGVLVALAFVYWARHWGIPARGIRAAGMVMAAFILAFFTLRNRHLFLGALPFILAFVLAGAAVALWPHVPTEALVAGALSVSGVASAGVMARLVREADVERAAH